MPMYLTKLPNGEPEIFSAVQGEGGSLGMPCIFVRFNACTLDCVFCDTAYSKQKDSYEITVSEVVKKIIELSHGKINSVVFTGGEPLLQQDQIEAIIKELQPEASELSWWFEIETNGTIEPNNYLKKVIDSFNCSPKLANSMNEKSKRYKPEVLKSMVALPSIDFKFVTDGSANEISEIKDIVNECKIADSDIMLMPKGDNSEDVLNNTRKLVPIGIAEGWQVTTRLHILLFEKKRGV
jgi:7-carboxy-7-deazaguanine synthase